MTKINWYPGHMHRSHRQLQEQLQRCDLVIEARDARAPLASSSPLMPQLLANKALLILLNKADLADPNISRQWQRQLQGHQHQVLLLNSSASGIAPLLHHLRQHWSHGSSKGQRCRAQRAIIVGVPNVGKSSLINALTAKLGIRRRLKVENRAGVTRQIDHIALSPWLTIADSPGVLAPNLSDQQSALILALLGSIKEQILPHHDVGPAMFQLFQQLYPSQLPQVLKLENAEPQQMIEQLACRWGLHLNSADQGMEQTTRRLLHQFSQGKLGRFTLEFPPKKLI